MNHALLAAFLLAGLGAHTPAIPSLPHGIRLDGIPDQKDGYANKWALIVGVNYSGRLKLDRAENDATAVRDLLKAHFGYKDENILLLTAAEATKKAIEDALTNGHLGKAEKNDSILFFFAGHGGASKEEGRGEIYPANVEFDEANRTPKASTVLRMEEDVVSLIRQSKARHKLLILDCCSSGAALRTLPGRREKTVNDQAAASDDVFTAKAFQALTACRETQKASDDGKGGHSPFTFALLQALQAIPIRQKDIGYFTVNQLFGAMGGYMAGMRRGQTPQCQWLDEGQGEFHFYPDHVADFTKEDIDSTAEQRMLVAMGPGTFGNWWFQETPWLMPSVRYEILNVLPAGGSKATDDGDRFDKTALESAAREVAAALAHDPDKKVQKRAEHLSKLLDARGMEEEAFQKILDSIVKDLEDMTKDAADPKDLHYLAVLRQMRGEDSAEDAYKEAMRAYQTGALADPTLQPLEALCQADLAYYYLHVGSFSDAASCFVEARKVYPAPPPAFRIFTLCSESDAWLGLGSWGRADEKLKEALELAQSEETVRSDPLKAAVHQSRGWFCMNRWQVRDAVAEFQQSDQILDAILGHDPSDVSAFILRCKNDQETAMLQRFLGDAQGALKKYRELTAAIREKIGNLRTNTATDIDLREARERLVERLAASLERQGDCNLFGDRPDLAQASDNYRRAILSRGNLPEEREAEFVAGLMYKRAIALTLPSPVQDLDLASALVQEAGKCYPVPPRWVAFYAKTAEALVGYFGEADGKAQVLARLRKAIRDRKKELGTDVRRDQMESLLFTYKLLIQMSIPGETAQLAEENAARPGNPGGPSLAGVDRLQALEDVDQLLGLCHRMVVWSGPKKDLLFYLRRYYDTAIRAELVLKPTQVKPIIEAACEAMGGTPLVKRDAPGPMLVLYTLGDQCHLFLDVPRGVSKDFPVENQTLDQLRDASRTGQRVRLAVGLKKQLDALQEPLDVRWDDPIGFFHSWSPDGVRVAADIGAPGVAVAPAPQSPATYFPFDLQGVKQADPPAKAVGDKSEAVKQLP